MFSKNDIINEIYNNKLIDNILENISIKKNDYDDFKQEIFLILIEYNEDKIIELYNKKQLKYFIIKIIMNQYFSKNSTFFTKYKKYYQIINSNKNINTEMEDE